MIEQFPSVLASLVSLDVLLALTLGTILGIIVGALPGLGTVLGLVMVLPFTFEMDGVTAIALLLSVYVSSIYGGSLTAILINIPGTPQSAASVLDGYPMAKKGQAALAIGYATVASFIGGVFSLVVLVLAAPLLAKLSLQFGPIEMFALLFMALTMVAWVSGEEIIKGVLAAAIGLFVALVGFDDVSGVERFAFDSVFLSAGFGLIPLLIGVFAISEILFQAATLRDSSTPAVTGGGFKMPPWAEWKSRIWVLVRSCSIGTFIGILPGTGATTAVFVSYADARKHAKDADDFGKGAPSGLIASESANNAVSGGALVPMLSLGIPGDGGTAVLLGALTIHSVIPGMMLFAERPDVVLQVFMLLMIANVAMLVIGAVGAGWFSKLLNIPISLLVPLVLVISLIGAFATRSNPVDLVAICVFGFFGFILRILNFPMAALVIGFVLGKPLEFALRQGMAITGGHFGGFFKEPIALGLLLVSGAILGTALYKELFRKR